MLARVSAINAMASSTDGIDISPSMMRITTATYDWQHQRLKLGIYLIVTSPEFAVQR